MKNHDCKTIGSSDMPPIIFLHGFMGQGKDWQPIAESLAERYCCLWPDLPGHGKHVDWLPDRSFDFATIAAELVAWLDSQNLPSVTLVGYSMGGRIALHIACHYPERIARLVLENANPGLNDEIARQQRVEWDQARAKELIELGLESFLERWYDMPLFDSLHRRPELLTRLKQSRRHNDARWLAKIISDLSPGRQISLWEQLPCLSLPVLLVGGALDSKYVDILTRIQSKLPRAELKIIANAGHNVHLEQPTLFINHLTRFLTQRDAHGK
ncbi:2-succinyl-6-hydroxy-2,4-cyclohexadiene-1-carboxylate synthase [Anaerolineales bacterium HSG25]|nr:2-succinyl-6-hydroxy-2,4-cyclohexadiene-1-carboxylate synthase [Anaerolineales bacterium HSG25]